jgi:hypothetical protein
MIPFGLSGHFGIHRDAPQGNSGADARAGYSALSYERLAEDDSSSATTYTGQVATALTNRKGEAGNQLFPCFSHSHLRTSVHCPELRAPSSAKRGSCESWGKGCGVFITHHLWSLSY